MAKFDFFKKGKREQSPPASAGSKPAAGTAKEPPRSPKAGGPPRFGQPDPPQRHGALPGLRVPWWVRSLRWGELPWWVRVFGIIGLVGIGFAIRYAVVSNESLDITCYIATNVNPTGSGQVMLDQTGSAYPKGTQITLTAVPVAGYEFVSWSGDITGGDPETTVTLNANKDVTANFDTVRYEFTTLVSPTGGGTLSVAGGTYNTGTEITLRATPSPGHEFIGWSGDAAGGSPEITIIMDADKTINAIFGAIQYELITTVSPVGGGEVLPAGGLFDSGDRVILTAVPAPDYEFTGWSGNATGTSPEITVTMDDARTVTANFQSTFQEISYDMPARISASVVVFGTEVQRGDVIEGDVELIGEFTGQDRSFDWSLEILNPEGRKADIFRGHWVTSNHYEFNHVAVYSGAYRLRVRHNSLFDKRLVIRIKPQGWQDMSE